MVIVHGAVIMHCVAELEKFVHDVVHEGDVPRYWTGYSLEFL